MEENIKNESPTISSNFFTNKKNGNTLIKEFEGVLHHNHHIKNLDAVVGLQIVEVGHSYDILP